MAYIISMRDSYILWKDYPAENLIDQDVCKVIEDWDIVNMKVTGNIILCVSDAIYIKILELGTAKEMWELLQTEYGTPSVVVAFSLFKSILDLRILSDQHPRKALDQLQMYFMELKDTKFELPTKTQIMLLLIKLPPNMEMVAQKVATDRMMNITTFESIWELTILSYE